VVIPLEQPLAGLLRNLDAGRSPGEGTAQFILKLVGDHKTLPFMMAG
jgi:hypothetical protein